MSSKIVCDHCNKQIDNSSKKELKLSGKNYDLCVNCHSRIEKWMNKKEEKTEIEIFG